MHSPFIDALTSPSAARVAMDKRARELFRASLLSTRRLDVIARDMSTARADLRRLTPSDPLTLPLSARYMGLRGMPKATQRCFMAFSHVSIAPSHSARLVCFRIAELKRDRAALAKGGAR